MLNTLNKWFRQLTWALKVSKEQCSLTTEAGKLFHWIIVLQKKDRYSEDTSLERDEEFPECEWRVLRRTGRRSPRKLTEMSPRVNLKRALNRLSIRRCSRVRHPRSSTLYICISVPNQQQQRLQAVPLCITIVSMVLLISRAHNNISNNSIPFSFKKNNRRTKVTRKTYYYAEVDEKQPGRRWCSYSL